MGILNEIKKEVTSDSFRSISGMVFAVEREEVNYLIELSMKLREDLLTVLDLMLVCSPRGELHNIQPCR